VAADVAALATRDAFQARVTHLVTETTHCALVRW